MINEQRKHRNELLATFHAQFAENQRTREQSFLKIVGFLGAVVFGYAIVYYNGDNGSQELTYAAIASVILLGIGGWVVTVIAYNFRRDQYVNSKIRERVGLIGGKGPFPESYNPRHICINRNMPFSWMPGIFGPYYAVFPVFQILITTSYILFLLTDSGCHSVVVLSIASLYTIYAFTIIVLLVVISMTLSVVPLYYAKLCDKLNDMNS